MSPGLSAVTALLATAGWFRVIHCLVSPGLGLVSLIIIITIIQDHHCSVSPGFGLVSLYYQHHYHSGSSLLCQSRFRPAHHYLNTISSSSLSLLILYSLLSVSGSRPALCSIGPSGSGCYQTDKIYNIIHSFTLVILSMHRKGSAKCALQFINFDIDTNKQYLEKEQSLFVYCSENGCIKFSKTSSLLYGQFHI